MIISGLACPFQTWSDPRLKGINGYDFLFEPGCFRETLLGQRGRLLVAQCDDYQLASVADHTLRLWEAPAGLMYEAQIPAGTLGAFVVDGIRHGFIRHVCPKVYPRRVRRVREGQVFERVDLIAIGVLMFLPPHFPTTSILLEAPVLQVTHAL